MLYLNFQLSQMMNRPASAIGSQPLQLKGERYPQRLKALQQLQHTLGLPDDIVFAALSGNYLNIDGTEVELVTHPPLDWQSETLSSKLGENRVFYLKNTQRHLLGAAALMEGGAYQIFHINQNNQFAATGLSVISKGLAAYPGMLIYTDTKIILPAISIHARLPRDTQAIALRLRSVLAQSGALSNRAITAEQLLLHLEPENLNETEIMEVMNFLQRQGTLAQFLSHVSVTRFRDYLRNTGVSWDYVYSHWDAEFEDSGLFFMGFIFGAGENVLDVISLLYVAVGKLFSESLIKLPEKLFAAISQLMQNPLVLAEKGLVQLTKIIEDHLWNLRFFEAGRIFGNILVTLLTLPATIKSLPTIAKATLKAAKTGTVQAAKLAKFTSRLVAKGATAVVRITVRELNELGVSIRQLIELARQQQALLLADGSQLIATNHHILYMSERGRPLGRLLIDELMENNRLFKAVTNNSKSRLKGPSLRSSGTPKSNKAFDLNDAEIDQALRNLDAEANTTRRAVKQADNAEKPTISPPVNMIQKLENIVEESIEQLVKEKGKKWLSPRVFGTRLHSIVEKRLKLYFKDSKFQVYVETPIKNMPGVPEAIKNMTIREYIQQHWLLAEYEKELANIFSGLNKKLDTKIGNLKPDMIIQNEAHIVVWDLTSQLRKPHLTKTMLYSEILSDGKRMISTGETYSKHFRKKTFNPAHLYGGASAAAQTKKHKQNKASSPDKK